MAKTDLLMMKYNSVFEFISNCGVESFSKRQNGKLSIPKKTQSQHADTQKPRRTRKSHNKVRTGCLTCKVRRKKCDETKPACERCIRTGRKCDGYVSVQSAPTSTAADRSPVTSGTLVSQDSSVVVLPVSEEIDHIQRTAEIHSDSGYGTTDNSDEIVNEEELQEFILSYNAECDLTLQPAPSSTSTSPYHISKRRRLNIFSPVRAVPRTPNFFTQDHTISDLESYCFSYFCHRTGPQFASYFDSSIWRAYSIRGALTHPVLFTTAAALGAVHRRFNYGISREAFEYCGHAARLQVKALRGLEQLKQKSMNRGLISTDLPGGGGGMGVYDRDVIMVAEMLLGLFEGFQANYDKAVGHMNNGLRYLLDRPMTLCHSESQYCAIESKPCVFFQLFHRIRCRALQLFGSPTKILVKWGDGKPLPEIPAVFKSLEEARDFIFTEADWIMHAPARVWQDVAQRSEAQNVHVTRILQWSVAYAELVAGMERTSQEKRACRLMKLTRNATYLLLYLTLFVAVDMQLPKMPDISEAMDHDQDQDSSLAYASQGLWEAVERREELNVNLARVKILAEAILEDHSIFSYDEHSTSCDTSIGPPKRRDNRPDSSNKTRHLVKTLTQKRLDDQPQWPTLSVYGVAERISAIEEHAVIDSVRNIIPEHVDPKWVDITCMMEDRRILLRYCRPDDYGLGMKWTQECWAF